MNYNWMHFRWLLTNQKLADQSMKRNIETRELQLSIMRVVSLKTWNNGNW